MPTGRYLYPKPILKADSPFWVTTLVISLSVLKVALSGLTAEIFIWDSKTWIIDSSLKESKYTCFFCGSCFSKSFCAWLISSIISCFNLSNLFNSVTSLVTSSVTFFSLSASSASIGIMIFFPSKLKGLNPVFPKIYQAVPATEGYLDAVQPWVVSVIEVE